VDGASVTPLSLLPENAPFSPVQRAWLNGFFAGLLTPGAPLAAAEPVAPKLQVAFVFASQTGTAEGLARKLAKAARQKGFEASARDLATLDLAAMATLGCVALIASTYGEGEPPDSARAFAEQLMAASGTPLAGLRFAVLALGDRNYTHFCRFGVFLDQRLGELGAGRLLDRVESDVDVDQPFSVFRNALLAALERLPGSDGRQPPSAPAPSLPQPAAAEVGLSDTDENTRGEAASWSKDKPFWAPILENRNLNHPRSDVETRHLALSLAGSGLSYRPGDALGIVAANAPAAVADVLAAAGLDGSACVTLADGSGPQLADALTHTFAIGKLTQPTLIRFQSLANSDRLGRLLDPDNADELNRYLWGRELVDLLLEFPGVVTRADELVALLPKLTPRLYSISSSQSACAQEVHITVSRVRFESHGRQRRGVASNYLAESGAAGGLIPCYVHENPRFRLPEDSNRPIVMIGPGTGIAPFRAFLQQRQADGAKGAAWLFFGHRRQRCDFLYAEELAGFLSAGTLARLDTAFSRDGSDKVYVQHRILEAGRELWTWICAGAHLYVCGDASQMARDVDRALQTVLMKHGHLSDAQAKLDLQALAAERRYCRDVY
jgi:sulfite reductase (NADPH) flavoprotein alpha-component